jgi:hypothetical protein
MTLAKYLQLPAGWTATRFLDYVELYRADGSRAGIPVPYDPMPREEWVSAAKIAIGKAEYLK